MDDELGVPQKSHGKQYHFLPLLNVAPGNHCTVLHQKMSHPRRCDLTYSSLKMLLKSADQLWASYRKLFPQTFGLPKSLTPQKYVHLVQKTPWNFPPVLSANLTYPWKIAYCKRVNSHGCGKLPFIDDLPGKKMVMFNGYVQ